MTMEEAGVVEAGDCETKRNGKIRCVTDDRNVKVVFKPSKTVAGEYSMRVQVRDRYFAAPVGGPLRFDLITNDVQWAGISDRCIAFNAKLRCR